MKRLGKSKVLLSSYVWLFLVPLGANLLAKGQEDWLRRLPFTWQLWFYAACALSAASLIFSITCPVLVRKYDRFEEFLAEGRGSMQLLRALEETLKMTHSQHDEMITANFQTRFTVKPSPPPRSGLLPAQIPISSLPTIPPELQAEAFWFIRDLADCCAPIRRTVCFAFYCAGFAFAGIIVLQNVFAVVRLSL